MSADKLEAIAHQARRRFGPFLQQRVNPGATDRDESGTSLSRELLKEAAGIGLLSYALPRELGGGGADTLAWGVVLEQVGYVCEDQSLPLLIGVFERVAEETYRSGKSHFIDEYARPMATGDRFGAFAYTDGTDPFSFRSRAVKAPGGDYILSGEKPIVTGGLIADTFLVYLRNESNDLVVFVVDRNDPGVDVSPIQVSGMRAAGLASLRLVDVRLPEERLLVASDGLSHAQGFLNSRRVLHACAPLGRMQAIFESCIRSLRQTVRYEEPLTDFKNVQAALGRMHISIETARSTVYRALEQARQGKSDPLFDPLHSIAKYHVTEQAVQLSLTALRLMGGIGYLKEHSYERYLRDFTGLIAGAGTQDILEVDLGIAAISRLEEIAEKEERS